MAAPTISAVTPAEGLSVGKTFVEITGTGFNDEVSGGTVRVFFGGVASPEFGVVDDTKVIALTPGGALGKVDVVVENVTPNPSPPPDDLVEPGTLVEGFEYKRPVVATREDLTTHSPTAIVTRTLLEDLRRTVIANIHHDMHPEYVDPLLDTQEKQAAAPSLKILGPTTPEDREHAINERVVVDQGGGVFGVFDNPVTLRLDYAYVGVGRTAGEAHNLFLAVTRYFKQTPFLQVFANGVDDADGVVEFELAVIWEQRADFRSQATRQAIYQFEGAFTVRGIHVVTDPVGEGRELADDVTVEVVSIPQE